LWNISGEAAGIFFILQYNLSMTKVMTDGNTVSDPVTGTCEDKLVDNKQLLHPIAFVAVKAEVTVSYNLFFISPSVPLSLYFASQFTIICVYTVKLYKGASSVCANCEKKQVLR
jgi:hypothetical protein